MLSVKCDAATWPNPGTGSIGFAVADESGNVIYMQARALSGTVTNNMAEYQAVVTAIEYLRTFKDWPKVAIYTDSQLVVNQVNGEWQCNKIELEAYRDRVRQYIKDTDSTLTWIPREQNALADALAGRCLPNKNYLAMKQALKK